MLIKRLIKASRILEYSAEKLVELGTTKTKYFALNKYLTKYRILYLFLNFKLFIIKYEKYEKQLHKIIRIRKK